jgi:hypothetical protein
MALQRFHRAVDQMAMWVEDRLARSPMAWRPAVAEPLHCYGPLPELPAGPDRHGAWSAPSPHPDAAGAPLQVVISGPERPPRGTVVLVPPWKISRARLVSGWAALLRGAGFEVWLLVPPHHMGRAAPHTRSGEGFVTPDLARLRQAVEQLTLEVRLLCALAARRGGEVALLGLSLGGLAAAHAATTPEAPPSLAVIAPPLDLAAVLTRTRIGRRYRRLAAAAGAPIPAVAELRAQLGPFDPGQRPPVSRRIFLAHGRHDGVATSRGPRPLVQGWGVMAHAYPRGHLTLLFGCRQVRADLLTFLGP